MKAVVVDPQTEGRLTLQEVDPPVPEAGEAVVRVAAISLNRGEVRRALSAERGRPGWDLAGVVERPAAKGVGPAAGTRVVGLLPAGAWAEYVAVPVEQLAPLPDAVSFAQAATLPVAGLTALHALYQAGSLLGRAVLVTGASGGVGNFAVQLAHLSGARVVGLIRQPQFSASVREAGADEVIVGDIAAAAVHGPYHLVVESVGGRTLGEALGMLAPDGTCVALGASDVSTATFDVTRFYWTGGARLFGLRLFHELRHEPASVGLARLAGLIAAGKLTPRIEVEAPWTAIAEIARRLIDRRYAGKAVLHVG